MWRIWAKTIGSKIGDTKESDIAAVLRTILPTLLRVSLLLRTMVLN